MKTSVLQRYKYLKNVGFKNSTNTGLSYFLFVLKVQCVRFTGIYWQTMAETEYNIHEYVVVSVLLPKNNSRVFVILD